MPAICITRERAERLHMIRPLHDRQLLERGDEVHLVGLPTCIGWWVGEVSEQEAFTCWNERLFDVVCRSYDRRVAELAEQLEQRRQVQGRIDAAGQGGFGGAAVDAHSSTPPISAEHKPARCEVNR